jgi:hypothetical protein
MVITVDWWSFKAASMKSSIAAIEESKRGLWNEVDVCPRYAFV